MLLVMGPVVWLLVTTPREQPVVAEAPGQAGPSPGQARISPGLNTPAILPSDRFRMPADARKREDRVAEPALQPSGPSTFTMSPPYAILTGRSFRDGSGTTVVLSGIEGPGRDTLCLDDARAPWACGLWARAALNNFTRNRELTCIGDRSLPEPIPVSCRHADGDLAAQLVESGFARPEGGLAFGEAAAAARSARRGLWIGNWTYKEGSE